MSKKNVITVRNLGTSAKPADLETKWATLESAVTSIFTLSTHPTSLEELYRIAEDLYVQKYLPLQYNLQSIIEAYLLQKLEQLTSAENPEFLEAIDAFWKQFCSQVRTIRNVFLRFDRSSKDFKYNTVQSISLALFTNVIVKNPTVKRKLVVEILNEIRLERSGEKVNSELLGSVVEMLNFLQVYDEVLQGEFLKASREFYQVEGERLVTEYDVPRYLMHVAKRIEEEKLRVKTYMNRQTENALLDILHKHLVELHVIPILNKGFDHLLDKSMYEELILINKLFQKFNEGFRYLLAYFKEYITQKGLSITEIQNEKNMIQDLLDFKDDLEKIITTSFDDKRDFHECVRGAFKNFIDNSNNRIAQLLAGYIDKKLRCKDISDENLEVVLDKVIKLFKYIQGKDIFGAFYKKSLAKRLLLGKSASQDAEHSMISKLKEECGAAFTSNIEGMFQDINLSKTINASFKQRLLNSKNGFNGDFSVNVLTSSYWPNYPSFKMNLPVELVAYQQAFEKFYLGNHSGRKLLWQSGLSHCLVKGSFDSGNKELQVSLFQTIVLLLFNNADKIAFKEMQESTGLDQPELERTLLSLACGKTRVLVKNPKGKDIDDEDTFAFNDQFTDKLFRVRINQIQLQESAEDEKETERNVLVDRQFQIDAAIVRVMKNRKSIKHNLLVRELYTLLDIPVNQTDLKKRIELLIEREYMERDKDNKSNYIYIA